MTCTEIIEHIESWAPKEISWQKDNAGLQVGSGSTRIKNIMLSLDAASEKVIDEAIEKNCNFIITHHPLIFYPIKKIETNGDLVSRIITKLIKNDITLYSAHTNLDFTKNGVSYSLAKALGLAEIEFLSSLKINQYKFVVFVPESHLDIVSEAIFNAGGGIIGEYSKCSFRTRGTGTSRGSASSNPSIGEKEVFTKIDEVKVEVIINSWVLNKVISAVKKVHPYEEAAYDIMPLNNSSINYGAGAIGILNKPMGKDEFLEYTAECLKNPDIRFSGTPGRKIKKVAVCGGSGSDHLNDAIKAGADAFITADIKYHTFQEAEDKLLLIDGGHYETEIISLDELKQRIENKIKSEKINVIKFSGSTNPVNFYNKLRS